jgi:DNA-binding transcriptional MerR regulator
MPFNHYFDIHVLSSASGISERNIRHFTQLKLLDPPVGKTRGARYTDRHLADLLAIADMQQQGWSISRMLEARKVTKGAEGNHDAAGADDHAAVVKHEHAIGPGVSLVFQPSIAGIDSEGERKLAAALSRALAAINGHSARNS